ncbi:MAG: alpha/beta hydrolase [Pseudomonadota bacterium]
MKRFVFVISAAMLAAACTSSEYSQDITDTFVEGDRLYISGTLNALTYDEIEQQIAAHPELKTVVLEDIDGSIDDDVNLETGLLIHEAGLDTFVPADGQIESGAVDLFCAGRNRIAERGAKIGVHSWAAEDGLEGGDLPEDDPEHQPYIAYFETIACPVSFYWYTLEAAPADGMHYMSEDELLTHSVATEIR